MRVSLSLNDTRIPLASPSGSCCSLMLCHIWILLFCVRVRVGCVRVRVGFMRVRIGCVREVSRRGRRGGRVNKHTVEAVSLDCQPNQMT